MCLVVEIIMRISSQDAGTYRIDETAKAQTSLRICAVSPEPSLFVYLSYDVVSGRDVTLCTKIDKPLVVYRFWYSYEMTSITTVCTYIFVIAKSYFFTPEMEFQKKIQSSDK